MTLPAPNEVERHYRPQEAAALLGLAVVTLRRLESRGELQAVRLAGQLRFPASAINEYLRRCGGARRRTAPRGLLESGGRPRGRRRR